MDTKKLTEKEKMIKGLLYDATESELTKDREIAEELIFKFNSLPPSKRKEKDEIMHKLFGKVGKNAFIRSTLYMDYGYNTEVGDNFYANHNLTILDCAKVTFGNNVFIAPNCGFYTAAHPIDSQERNTLLEYAKPITIGNNVWIGAGVQVMPGVTIGDNTVIGGGSIVTKDIPSDVVAVGNPCKVLRKVTDRDKMLN